MLGIQVRGQRFRALTIGKRIASGFSNLVNLDLIQDQRFLSGLNTLRNAPIYFGRDFQIGKRSHSFFSRQTLLNMVGRGEYFQWGDLYLQFLQALVKVDYNFLNAFLSAEYAARVKRFLDQINTSDMRLDLYLPYKTEKEITLIQHETTEKKGEQKEDKDVHQFRFEIQTNVKLLLKSRKSNNIIYGSPRDDTFETHFVRLFKVISSDQKFQSLKIAEIDNILQEPQKTKKKLDYFSYLNTSYPV